MTLAIAAPAASQGATPGQRALAAGVALFLLAFLVVPTATVVYVAFTEKGTGAFTLVNFLDFARTDLFIRSFWNSVYVSAMSVVWASVLALPLAVLTTRFDFRGALLIQTLGFIPLVMPPFVGAVAMQLLFGRNGSVNLLLADAFGLAATDASFAKNLLGATPTEQVRSRWLAMRSRMCLAITTPSPSRRSEPVTSRNASSSDSGSTYGVAS